MNAWQRFTVIALLAVSSAGCHGIIRESYYSMSAERGELRPSSHYTTYAGPTFYVASEPGDVVLIVDVQDYSPYPVAAGPLPYVWILPYFLFSWIWYDPLPEHSLTIRLTIDGADGEQTLVRPEQMRLRSHGEVWILPALDEEATWTGSGFELRYDAPGGLGEQLEFDPGGIYVQGERALFPVISLTRAAGWKVFLAG